MTKQEIDETMEEIDATVDTSNYGIVDGIGVVQIVNVIDKNTVVVDSNSGWHVVKQANIKPYDGR